MRLKILAIILSLMSLNSSLSWAQEEAQPAPPETQPHINSAFKSEVIFSLPDIARPEGGRYSVKAEDNVEVCLRLNQALPLFKNVQENLVGFRLVLEDNENPPHQMPILIGNKLQKLKQNSEGCYAGRFKIPSKIPSALYQVADLLLYSDKQNYFSVRDYLYSFSQADELQVDNPQYDRDSPLLIKISAPTRSPKKNKVAPKMLKIALRQVFQFEDKSKLVRKSMRADYAFFLDNIRQESLSARCRKKGNKSFVCEVETRRLREDLSLPQARLSLERISVKDKAGNLLVMEDPQAMVAKTEGGAISFDFLSLEKKSREPDYQLQTSKEK